MLSHRTLVVVATAAALALFGASLARADDHPRYAKAPIYGAPTPFQWRGIDVGAHDHVLEAGVNERLRTAPAPAD
ncbi:MAG: hypothetical protein AB1586_08025 [Pseudomonadota bacterium]|jgi:hypothetical protein